MLEVAAPLKIRATGTSLPQLPGPASQAPSPFLLYQTEHAGQANQNLILRIENGARFTAGSSKARTLLRQQLENGHDPSTPRRTLHANTQF